MKNASKIIVLFMLLSLISSYGCKKDKPAPAELLSAASCWQITRLEGFEPGAAVWISVPVEACLADNCYSFSPDQRLLVDESQLKCDTSDLQIETGAWSITDDGKKLSLTDNSEVTIADVLELTADKLVYETKFEEARVRITMETR